MAAERLPADHEPLQPPTPEAWLHQSEAVPLLDLPDFPLLPGVELAGEVQQQRQQHLQPPLQQQRITTFIAGAGGRGRVAACAILEEADARLVKMYLDLADAGGAAAVEEVAPSPERDGLEMKKGV